MKALLQRIDQRTGVPSALGDWLRRPLAGPPRWRNVWPATIAFTMLVQAISGVTLWAYYSPGAQSAWESVHYLQTQVPGGWLIRAIHHYAGQVLLVLIGLYLARLLVRGTYRAPRELLFWAVVLMGLCTLALNLTGDLLPWDQNGYWSTRMRTGFLSLLPGVGEPFRRLVLGGSAMGHLTLARFFALHAGVFSAAMFALIAMHAWIARRHELENQRLDAGPPDAVRRLSEDAARYWPDQAWRDAVACLAVLGVVLALSAQHGLTGSAAGAPLGGPADAARDFAAARPEWSFRGLYEFVHLFPGSLEVVPIFVIPGLVVLVALAMPWIGRRPLGHVLNLAIAGALVSGVVALSYMSYARDAHDPSHQRALAADRAVSPRVAELAVKSGGIPVAGAIALLHDDPKTEGPRLFQQHCAGCHNHADAGCDTEQSSAPSLTGFADRRWIAGLLDPKRIRTPEYFGKTKLKKMSDWVKDILGKPSDPEELTRLIAALSAEAHLPSQRRRDERDAAVIRQGRSLFDGVGCLDCHKFHGQGKLGTAPELTGYGSRQWLLGIISDPSQGRFYGRRNDRMPAYRAAGDPGGGILSEHDLGLIVEWLRGEWYEPPEPAGR